MSGSDYSNMNGHEMTTSRNVGLPLSPSSPEPVNRGTSVEKVQAPETAKNMKKLFETGQFNDLHRITKTVPTPEAEINAAAVPGSGSGVFENEPIRLEGVVRSDEAYNPEEPELLSGMTKSLLDQWKVKGSESFVINRSPVLFSEEEGKVLENEPTRRDDVVREADYEDPATILPTQGQTKELRHQWSNRNNQFVKDLKPIKLVENENEPAFSENIPKERSADILREENELSNDHWLRKGLTKDLTSQWATRRNVEILARDKQLDMPQPGTEAIVRESDPIRLEGVAREDDRTHEEIQMLEKGKAKNLANKWLNMNEDFKKNDFNIESEMNAKEAGVFENSPETLKEGVVRSTDYVDEVVTQQGVAKLMTDRFLDSETWALRNPKSWSHMELAQGPEVLENEPACLAPEVVRSDAYDPETDRANVTQGFARNLVDRWVRQDVQGADLAKPTRYDEQPSLILEAEKAKESGIFENKPEAARTDVVRGEEYVEEQISVKATRVMRDVWMKMGQKEEKTGQPKQVRFTPPRDRTPPHLHQEDFTSLQQMAPAPTTVV